MRGGAVGGMQRKYSYVPIGGGRQRINWQICKQYISDEEIDVHESNWEFTPQAREEREHNVGMSIHTAAGFNVAFLYNKHNHQIPRSKHGYIFEKKRPAPDQSAPINQSSWWAHKCGSKERKNGELRAVQWHVSVIWFFPLLGIQFLNWWGTTRVPLINFSQNATFVWI